MYWSGGVFQLQGKCSICGSEPFSLLGHMPNCWYVSKSMTVRRSILVYFQCIPENNFYLNYVHISYTCL